MNPNSAKSRERINQSIFFTAVITLIFLFVTHQYSKQTTKKETPKPQEKFIFNFSQINEIIEFSLKNKFGVNVFQKIDDPIYPWRIKSQKNIIPKKNKVTNLLSELKSLKIKNIIPLDEINYKNYSLDAPSYELILLIDGLNNVQLKVGLINRLKRSAFIQLNKDNYIYEVEFRRLNQLESRLQDFIDRTPLSFTEAKLASIKIKQKGKKTIKRLSINKKNNEWRGTKTRVLDTDKVKSFIIKLQEIKSLAILDSLTSKEMEKLEKIRKKSSFVIDFQFQNKQQLKVVISRATKLNISGIQKINKKYVLWTENRPFPLLISENTKKILMTKEKTLRSKIKKLIY